LNEDVIPDLLFQTPFGRFYGSGLSLRKRLGPFGERLHVIFSFQRHIQRVVPYPAGMFLLKAFQLVGQLSGALTKGKLQNPGPAGILRVIIHRIRFASKKSFTSVQCVFRQQTFTMQIVKIDEIWIPRKSAERLIR